MTFTDLFNDERYNESDPPLYRSLVDCMPLLRRKAYAIYRGGGKIARSASVFAVVIVSCRQIIRTDRS